MVTPYLMYSYYPEILYEDNHILIVNKKPGDIVQGDKTGDTPLSDIIKQYIKDKYNKPGDVFLGVIHRIDRPVSGAVIFARTSKALARLNAMLKNREIHKTYLAVVKNKPPEDKGHLINYLYHNEKNNKTYVSGTEKNKYLRSELTYELLQKSNNYFLLKINLITGRHHQIRAQLAAAGCPIKGDLKYGYPRPNADGSICLHSLQTEFLHPVQQKSLQVIAPPPANGCWKMFTLQAIPSLSVF